MVILLYPFNSDYGLDDYYYYYYQYYNNCNGDDDNFSSNDSYDSDDDYYEDSGDYDDYDYYYYFDDEYNDDDCYDYFNCGNLPKTKYILNGNESFIGNLFDKGADVYFKFEDNGKKNPKNEKKRKYIISNQKFLKSTTKTKQNKIL